MSKQNIIVALLVTVIWMWCPSLCEAQQNRSTSDIKLGMSTALSGPTAELGRKMRAGVLTALARSNRAGGINGHRLTLIVRDDGYEPFRTAPNMRHLTQDEGVLVVIGNVGTPTAIAAVPIAKTQKVLFYAPFSGAGLLRKDPPERYVINYRASYAQEISAMVNALISNAGIAPTDIAFFTQRDSYGDAGYVEGVASLRQHGLQDERNILHVRYSRNTLAVENALADLLFAKTPPKAVILVGAYSPCAKFIRLAKRSGLQALFLNVSFVGSQPLLKKLGTDAENIIITQVVPPLQNKNLPIVRDYIEDQNINDPSLLPNAVGLEGYIATRILVRAMETIPDEITRENIIDALEAMDTFDMGLGKELNLGIGQHQICSHVWPTILKNGEIDSLVWENLNNVANRVLRP